MTRSDTVRAQLLLMVRAVPFRSFAMNMENGDRIIVEHPENISFDADEDGLHDFAVISSKVRYWGNLSAITTIAVLDRGELPATPANGKG